MDPLIGFDGLVTVSSDQLAVSVRPGFGCELVDLTDARTGVQLLWRSPWGMRPAGEARWAWSSEDFWMQHTAGGWSMQFPHAGSTGEHGRQPFHGEAGTAAWDVLEAAGDRAVFRTVLMHSPIELVREVSVSGDTLTLRDTASNQSPDDLTISWGYHPSFGEPFLAPGVRIEADAERFVLGRSPDGVQDAGRDGLWPRYGELDLSVVPERTAPRALLAHLRCNAGRYRLINDQLGLAIELTWPVDLLPHLWLWQEFEGSSGYPWFRRAYVMAVEPQSMAQQFDPPTIELPGSASLSTEISARVSHPDRLDVAP